MVVVRHIGEAGPAGAVLGRLGEGCFIEADALLPGHFSSLAAHHETSGSARTLVDSLADLIRQPVSRLALWTAVVLVAGDAALVGPVESAVFETPLPRVLRSGGVEVVVVGRGDLDLPVGSISGDPVATVDLDRLTVRVVVRPGYQGLRLWARIHRGRERLFSAALRAEGPVLVADLLLPGGGDPLVVDVVDRLTAPAPIDGPAPARRAIKAGRQAMAASATAWGSTLADDDVWAVAARAWLRAGTAWDELSDDGRCAIAASIAIHAATVARCDDSAGPARRLRDRTIDRAEPEMRAFASEGAAARLLGRPPSIPAVVSPLLEPRLRATMAAGRSHSDGPADLVETGPGRLELLAGSVGEDAARRQTVALGWHGVSLCCELLGRVGTAAEAAERSAVLAARI